MSASRRTARAGRSASGARRRASRARRQAPGAAPAAPKAAGSARLPPPAVAWVGGPAGHLSLLDQTALPDRTTRLAIRDVETLWTAIRRLVVRGAPAIGVAAAYGVVLGARRAAAAASGLDAFRRGTVAAIDRLASSRPTAVNLFWALDRMRRRLDHLVDAALSALRPAGARTGPGARRRPAVEPIFHALLEEARAIHREDEELCRAIGRHGEKLLRSGWCVLTHCNAGALATGGSGTALSVIYEAVRAGKTIGVYSDETRPLLQGARLTSWELQRAGIDVTVICDGAAASVLASGKVRAVIVGADRIASNGDVANKIGTLGVAVLAHAHGVPFYVAAPSTTFDLGLATGAEIPIEERSPLEVVESFGRRTAPRGVRAFNPAFDVTPARYVSGIITEAGVLRPPYGKSIRKAIGTPSS